MAKNIVRRKGRRRKTAEGREKVFNKSSKITSPAYTKGARMLNLAERHLFNLVAGERGSQP